MRVNFCTFGLGISGGNRFIFELANRLAAKGHTISIVNCGVPYDNWFGKVNTSIIECKISLFQKGLVKLRLADALTLRQQAILKATPNCDVNVATYWATAKPVAESDCAKKLYLVQHYEPVFHPKNKRLADLAKDSYLFSLKKLCVSHWLTKKVDGIFLGNGINLNRFKPVDGERLFDVMVVSRGISWKGNYDRVLRDLSVLGLRVALVDGSVSEKRIVELYQGSKVLVFLSVLEGFGYPPLEAMACGCAVISTECTEFCVDGVNCLLLDSVDANEVLNKIMLVLGDDVLRNRLVEGGFVTAKSFDFNVVVERFLSYL